MCECGSECVNAGVNVQEGVSECVNASVSECECECPVLCHCEVRSLLFVLQLL